MTLFVVTSLFGLTVAGSFEMYIVECSCVALKLILAGSEHGLLLLYNQVGIALC